MYQTGKLSPQFCVPMAQCFYFYFHPNANEDPPHSPPPPPTLSSVDTGSLVKGSGIPIILNVCPAYGFGVTPLNPDCASSVMILAKCGTMCLLWCDECV
jgi:hypothetical protein